MTIRKLLLGTVAASGVMVIAAASEPVLFPAVSQAEAATSVSVEIGFNVFYDRLGSHGDWVTFHDRYVWVPRVEASWRPYFNGHWVYTKTYGWYWVSDEPFAWAVYHYGRWAFDPEIGWYWDPGRRWAPAWVAWSHTDDEIAWAPLPPDYDDDEINVSISVSSVPVHYWHAVPIAFFVSVDLDDHIIRDRDHVRRVITRGEPKTVIVQNNIVVNNVIDIDIIQEKSKEKVVVYEEKPANDPEAAGTADGNTIAVFNPEVKEEPNAKPPKLKKAEEVAQEKKASGTLPEAPPADTAAPAEGTEPAATDEQQTGQQPEMETEEGQAAEQPAATTEGEAAKEPKGQEPPVKTEEGQAAEQPEMKTDQGEAAKTEQPAGKAKQAVEDEAPQPSEGQQAEQPAAKKQGSEKALEAVPEEEAPATAEPKAAKPEPDKKQDQKKACDPAVEECPPQ